MEHDSFNSLGHSKPIATFFLHVILQLLFDERVLQPRADVASLHILLFKKNSQSLLIALLCFGYGKVGFHCDVIMNADLEFVPLLLG